MTTNEKIEQKKNELLNKFAIKADGIERPLPTWDNITRHVLAAEIESKIEELKKWGSFSLTPLVQGRIKELEQQLAEIRS